MSSPPLAIVIDPVLKDFETSKKLAQKLSLPLLDSIESALAYPFVLTYTRQGLALQQTGSKAAGPVLVDFVGGAAGYRRSKGGGELIVKAVGGPKQQRPMVLDATAGLGRDGFVLANRGYSVTLCERSRVIASLLEDGLQRASLYEDEGLQQAIARISLQPIDAASYLNQLAQDNRPDVIVIDPMFPPSKKSALVKKDMQAFHYVVGEDKDSASLLEVAMEYALHRVVVKRPKKADSLKGAKPNHSVVGKAIRFDIYSKKAFDK